MAEKVVGSVIKTKNLDKTMSRCPLLSRFFATVRHVSQQPYIYLKIDIIFIQILPVAGRDIMFPSPGKQGYMFGRERSQDRPTVTLCTLNGRKSGQVGN